MVGNGDGAMLMAMFKSQMIMAKDRMEGVAESSGLSWSTQCAAQCTGAVLCAAQCARHSAMCGTECTAANLRGTRDAVQCSSSWERSPPLTPVLVGGSPALRHQAHSWLQPVAPPSESLSLGESCWLESGCMWCEGEGGG